MSLQCSFNQLSPQLWCKHYRSAVYLLICGGGNGFYRSSTCGESSALTGRKRLEVAAIMIHHSQNTCK